MREWPLGHTFRSCFAELTMASDTLTWLETHGLVTAEQSSLVTSMLDSGQMVVLTGSVMSSRLFSSIN
jgi:hypothetical protein